MFKFLIFQNFLLFSFWGASYTCDQWWGYSTSHWEPHHFFLASSFLGFSLGSFYCYAFILNDLVFYIVTGHIVYFFKRYFDLLSGCSNTFERYFFIHEKVTVLFCSCFFHSWKSVFISFTHENTFIESVFFYFHVMFKNRFLNTLSIILMYLLF